MFYKLRYLFTKQICCSWIYFYFVQSVFKYCVRLILTMTGDVKSAFSYFFLKVHIFFACATTSRPILCTLKIYKRFKSGNWFFFHAPESSPGLVRKNMSNWPITEAIERVTWKSLNVKVTLCVLKQNFTLHVNLLWTKILINNSYAKEITIDFIKEYHSNVI